MRDYGRVYTSFWTSEDVKHLSDDGKLLALYLLTSPHTTLTGTFRLPDGYASEDLGWDFERVRQGFEELSLKGFANRCETSKWAWIHKFLEWNPPENPNQWKAARRVIAQIPQQCAWRAEFYSVFECCSEGTPDLIREPSADPSETLSKSGSGTGIRTGTGTGGGVQRGSAPATVAPRAVRKSATRRCPPEVELDPEYATTLLPDVDAPAEMARFRDYEFRTPHSDWAATWRNWLRRCADTGKYARKKTPVAIQWE